MMNNEVLVKIVEMVLTSPGMNDTIKLDLKLTRKNVLILVSALKGGLSGKGKEEGLFSIFKLPAEVRSELEGLIEEILQKGGLSELHGKLEDLSVK